MNALATYVAAWRDTADRVIDLFAALSIAEQTAPTDCPGWRVRDVLAHLAAIESDLAGADAEADVGSAAPVDPGRAMAPSYTERGVTARADRSYDELLDELRTMVTRRAERLDAEPPTDLQDRAYTGPSGLDWTWETLLRNRAVDMWVHEQDVRRAVGRPGAMDSLGARLVTHTFAAALPYVVGKKVGAPAGTRAVVDVTGPVHTTVVVSVDDSGRAHRLDPADLDTGDVDVRLVLDTEAFTLLAAGRRPVDTIDVRIEGDHRLSRAVLEQLVLTL